MARQIQDDNKFTGVRLPINVRPTHYELSLKPNFEDFTFTGRVDIDYTSTEKPNNIVLHATELVIHDGTLHSGPILRPLTDVTYSKTSETATLEFQDGLEPTGTISLNFSGILNDKMRGFYRTNFKIANSDVTAATTQFEATDARKCFPCWDEPAVKATFSCSLIISKYIELDGQRYERVALSNMPEISRTGSDEELVVKFDKSPIMSTYLLAFIVGPFEMIEGTDSRRPIRVYTAPGKKEQGRFALDVACKALPFYEDYFGVKYPLPKMDMIAIPDFSSGAMENWGLITYREARILVDPNNSTAVVKQMTVRVVAHELAHQWFGNLVTMEWWTHLWLNEGFAQFMEFLCTDHIFPEYDIWSQFVSDTATVALSLDSLHNSHPIEVPVKHPSEIREIFDRISYEKGASVLRMLYNYIGNDCFRSGMKDYLTKFAYKNTVTEDLWDCLEHASNKPVRKLMSCWTSQKGYPWLSVECSTENPHCTKLMMTQNKFSADGTIPNCDANSSWIIPMDILVAGYDGGPPVKLEGMKLLEGKSYEWSVITSGRLDWLKLNAGTVGLYRTAYPDELARRLVAGIMDQTLPPMDRLGILDDYFALCQAGKRSTVYLLKVLEAFRSETNYPVWSSIDTCMGHLDLLLSNTNCKDEFKAFGRHLYGRIFERLTWEAADNESHGDALMRVLVIRRLIMFGHQEVVAEALKRFRQFTESGAYILPDFRSSVYLAASLYGTDGDFEQLFTMFRSSDLSEEKNRLASAIGFTRDPSRIERAAEFAFSKHVRDQDRIFSVAPIGMTKPERAWRLFQEKSEYIREKYGIGPHMVHMVKTTTENFACESKAKEVEEYFANNKYPGAERAIQQSLEKIRLNANWMRRDGATIVGFIKSSQQYRS